MEFKWNAQEKIYKYVHFLSLILFILISGYVLSTSTNNHTTIIIFCLVYFCLALSRHIFLSGKKSGILNIILPYAEMSALAIVSFFNNIGLALIILIIWDIVLDYKVRYGVIYAVIGYIIYMSVYYINIADLPLANIILLFLIAAFQFVLFVGFAFFAKKYNIQSRELRKTTAELNAKMITLQEMTLYKERNRIALEIHNNVGHQLTTALVQIEAAQMILDSDMEEGKRRLTIVKEQIRNGLSEMRKAVHSINAEKEYENFCDAVTKLINQVRDHGKISVDFKADNIEEASLDVKKTIYHLILESITNAIRHGGCTKVNIVISKINETAFLSIYNNGVIPENMEYGYGLSKIKEEIKRHNGLMHLKVKNGSFGLEASLPLYYKEGEKNR